MDCVMYSMNGYSHNIGEKAMSQEWYEYAVSIKDQTEKINNMLVFNICSFILLGMFAIGLFFINVFAFFVVVLSYIPLIVFNHKDKDIYAKKILFIGTFIFYMALEASFIFGILDFF